MLASFHDFSRRAKGRRTAIFLDYDGQLCPLAFSCLRSSKQPALPVCLAAKDA